MTVEVSDEWRAARRDPAHIIYPPLANSAVAPERSNWIQIVSAEGETMSKIEYLQQQAARAERLAKGGLDRLTIERLQAFAAECRARAMMLTDDRQEKAA